MHVSQVTAIAGIHPHRGPISRFLVTFSPLGLVRGILDYRRRQREYRHLMGMPDYLLRDVGLTRQQIIAGMESDAI